MPGKGDKLIGRLRHRAKCVPQLLRKSLKSQTRNLGFDNAN